MAADLPDLRFLIVPEGIVPARLLAQFGAVQRVDGAGRRAQAAVDVYKRQILHTAAMV